MFRPKESSRNGEIAQIQRKHDHDEKIALIQGKHDQPVGRIQDSYDITGDEAKRQRKEREMLRRRR